jgi:hypothetical protein
MAIRLQANKRALPEDQMRFIALGSVVLLASLQMGAQAAHTDIDKSHTIINLENAWNQAERLHDVHALKSLLAEAFIRTNYDGTFMDRDGFLRRIQGAAKDYQALENVGMKTYVYSNVVVVTGIFVEKMTIKGKKVENSSRFTDAWIFQNNAWECVASHYTLTSP